MLYEADVGPDDFVAFIPGSGHDPSMVTTIPKPKRADRGGMIPPAAHRFKPGQSGNPSGRPKSSFAMLLRDLLEAEEQKYTRKIVRALVVRACERSLPAINALLALAEPR